MEPRPVPAHPDEVGPTELRPPAPRQPYGPGPGQPYPPMGPGQPGQPEPRPAGPPPQGGGAAGPPPGEAPANQSFGTFSLRVQPADAEVLVDGERWMTPEGQERLVIQLTDGKHRVEVRKEGFEKFTTDIQVKRGETVTLNVSLLRLSAAPF